MCHLRNRQVHDVYGVTSSQAHLVQVDALHAQARQAGAQRVDHGLPAQPEAAADLACEA